MVSPVTNNLFYRTTDKIESNTLLNRGILDIFGYAIPTALNANNKYEALERITGSTMYFAIAFLSPLVMLPLFNKNFLRKAKIIDKWNDKGVEIVRLSKKYLVKDSKKMQEGIKELIYDLRDNPNTSKKTRAKFKNIEQDFQKILDKFPDKEVLRQELLKAHTKIAISDYITTGLMIIGGCFGLREMIQKISGRTGFSAEYAMADEEYTKKNAQSHEQNKKKKILISLAILLSGSYAANKFIQKSFLKQNPKGIMKAIKNNAQKFNYTDGKFMKPLPYFLITLFGDFPPFILSSRDKYERRDATVRISLCTAVFFGGDAILNGIFGRTFDKIFKTNLINKEGLDKNSGLLKKAMAPIYTLEELQKKTSWDKNLLKRTQKIGIGMYWLNLALVTLILGMGMPKALNYILKRDVHRDLDKKTNQENDKK